MNMGGRCGNTFSDSGITVIEKAVEYTVACSGCSSDVHQTYKFGRVYYQVAGLLRDKHISAEQCRVVQLSADIFAMELDIVGRSGFLAPETVERRELGAFKPSNIHFLIQFQFSRNRLTDDSTGLVQRKFQEQVR